MHLTLVGDAPASWSSDRITVKMLPPSQIPAALAEAQVFALPCRIADSGDRDGIPVAMMEAMAAGLPVVTTPVSGIPELVDDTVGWLVPTDDVPTLRQTLERITTQPESALRTALFAARKPLVTHELRRLDRAPIGPVGNGSRKRRDLSAL